MRLWPIRVRACRFHRMVIVACQPATIPSLANTSVDGTAVLRRCGACANTESYLMAGRWSLAQLTGDRATIDRVIAESLGAKR